MAYDALRASGSHPVVLNVANDTVVYAFLKDKIKFVDIPNLIEDAITEHPHISNPNLDDIAELTSWTQHYIKGRI